MPGMTKEELSIRTERSIRYHEKRQGFFDGCHTFAMLVAALGGCYAVIVLFILPDWPTLIRIIPSLFVVVISMVDVVFRFSTRATVHRELKQKFIDIDTKLETMGDEPSTDETNHIIKEIHTIEKQEPPVKLVLNAICRNETFQAKGYDNDEKPITITFWQRLLAPFIDFQPDKLR